MKIYAFLVAILIAGCARGPVFYELPDGRVVWEGYEGCMEAVRRGYSSEAYHRGKRGLEACELIRQDEYAMVAARFSPQQTERLRLLLIESERSQIIADCNDRQLKAKLPPGQVSLASCSSDKLRQFYAENFPGYKHMDLIELYLAYQMAVAKRVDGGILSKEDAKLNMAELEVRINTEIARRNSAASQERSQRLLDALTLQSLLQGQRSSLYEAGRILAEPLPSSSRPAVPPTITCVRQGNTITCN